MSQTKTDVLWQKTIGPLLAIYAVSLFTSFFVRRDSIGDIILTLFAAVSAAAMGAVLLDHYSQKIMPRWFEGTMSLTWFTSTIFLALDLFK